MRVARLVSVLFAAALVLSLGACGMQMHGDDPDASADELGSTTTTDSEDLADDGFEGLAFSDVGIYTSKSVGLSSLKVTVRGTVRNTSDKSVASSSFPELECNGTGYSADIEVQQLAPGESCEFAYGVECRVDEEHQSYEWSFSEGEGIPCQGLEDVPQDIDERAKARIAEMVEAKRAAESDEVKQNRRDAEEEHRATTCFVSWGGEFYHENPTCPGLEGDHNLEEMTIGKAIDGGYAPCELCTY